MKPLIGINLDYDPGPPTIALIQTGYVNSVVKAGGIPVLLAPIPDDDVAHVIARLDGLIMTGGPDYCPSNYGEEPHESIELMPPDRDRFDRKLITTVLKNTDMPVLGVCAGCQILNIVLGGSLIQDIKSELPQSTVNHSNNKEPWREGHNRHDVRIETGTYLSKLYGLNKVSVPTSHHQSIRKLGEGLKATAYCEDGIIEAVEHVSRPFTIGVQWHPERDFDTSKKLFEDFIRHAQQFSSKNAGKTNKTLGQTDSLSRR
jgi:putative glutamine amidotransferase